MKSFDPGFFENQPIPMRLLGTIRLLSEGITPIWMALSKEMAPKNL